MTHVQHLYEIVERTKMAKIIEYLTALRDPESSMVEFDTARVIIHKDLYEELDDTQIKRIKKFCNEIDKQEKDPSVKENELKILEGALLRLVLR